MLPPMALFMTTGVLAVEVGLLFSDHHDAEGTVDHAARAGASSSM